MIDNSTIPNSDFLKTLFHLCTFKKKDGPRQRVHWKTLRETELGSVYESLLELRPDIDLDNGSFTLISEAGNDRKSSGSYYTPSELVDHLVTTTIDPLLKEAKKTARKSTDTTEEYQSAAIESILKLTVCDPACGSGHFLVAALERIAMELAQLRLVNITLVYHSSESGNALLRVDVFTGLTSILWLLNYVKWPSGWIHTMEQIL